MDFVLRGCVCDCIDKERIDARERAYLVCVGGKSAGVFDTLPERFAGLPCTDCGGALIIPGLTDLHVHASQYAFRGLGGDLQLLDWLNANAFPEEARFADLGYADAAYDIFVQDLLRSATTRACIFATVHMPATLRLMEKLEKTGLRALVGRVSMDRGCPPSLCESDAETAARDEEEWIIRSSDFKNVRPIITPRFVPACSDALMRRLGGLREKYSLPVQSHLSENLGEIELVRSLAPDAECYGAVYDKYGLFTGSTVMAHCVHSGAAETELMRSRGVFAAHCPECNANIASGVAPVRRFLDAGVRVGLGSDVAGGSTLCLFTAMAMAVRCSKLRAHFTGEADAPLKTEEVFYMAARGGGEMFGKVGSFEAGFDFDAVVIDDAALRSPRPLTVRERLERLIYLADGARIKAKYVAGAKVFG
ncbi:MAG: amidohydrolase family protein [Oscillospiraceae bacterium]|nr:amidohydrolase family protein [Oscillospiraceae bacterium]